MNISLSPALQEYLNKKVESGLYGSADEIIEDALLRLQKQEQEQPRERRAQRDDLISRPLANARQKTVLPTETREKILESLKGEYIGTRR